MPISASAKKSLRVAERRASENKTTKLRLKRQIKQTTAESLSALFSMVDKAAKANVIHKNKAARIKARLAKRVASTDTSPVKPAKKTTKKS